MRNIVLIIFCVIGIYFVAGDSTLDILMDGEMPFVEAESSGFIDVDPRKTLAWDVTGLYQPGLITVIEFYDTQCSSCTGWMMPRLEKLNTLRPDVAIKLVHVSKNYYSYWGDKFGLDVPHVPFTVILDRDGEVLAADNGMQDDGAELLIEWINAELKRR